MRTLYLICIPLSLICFVGFVIFYSYTQDVIIKDKTGTYHIHSYATSMEGDVLIMNTAVKAVKACLNKYDGELENKKLFSSLFFPSIQNEALTFSGREIQEQSAKIREVKILSDSNQQVIIGLKGIMLTHTFSGTSAIRPFKITLTMLDLTSDGRNTYPFAVRKIVFLKIKENQRDI